MKDDDRERDTVPHGLTPPTEFVGNDPEDIPGAPEWMNEARRRDHAERMEIIHLMREVHTGQSEVAANQEMLAASVETLRDRSGAHDREVLELRRRIVKVEKITKENRAAIEAVRRHE